MRFCLWWFQWITLVRRHAEVIVEDDIIFPVFRKFCKVYPGRHLVGPISYYFKAIISWWWISLTRFNIYFMMKTMQFLAKSFTISQIPLFETKQSQHICWSFTFQRRPPKNLSKRSRLLNFLVSEYLQFLDGKQDDSTSCLLEVHTITNALFCANRPLISDFYSHGWSPTTVFQMNIMCRHYLQ